MIPELGVRPPSSRAEHSSIRQAPARWAASADAQESTHISTTTPLPLSATVAACQNKGAPVSEPYRLNQEPPSKLDSHKALEIKVCRFNILRSTLTVTEGSIMISGGDVLINYKEELLKGMLLCTLYIAKYRAALRYIHIVARGYHL